MKLRDLEIELESLESFENPNVTLEQYSTTPHLSGQLSVQSRKVSDLANPIFAKMKFDRFASEFGGNPRSEITACILHTIATQFADIETKFVVDLGCGCGILSCGAALLGAGLVVGIDIDPAALETSQSNAGLLDISDRCNFINRDVRSLLPADDDIAVASPDNAMLLGSTPDTVIMNPPFGTKGNKGLDLEFLRAALNICPGGTIYSLHKTATRNHVERKVQGWGAKFQVVAELKFDLTNSYKFHQKKSVDIAVDFIRVSRG